MKTKRDVVCYILAMFGALFALYFVWALVGSFVTLDVGLWLFTNWTEGSRFCFVFFYIVVGVVVTLYSVQD